MLNPSLHILKITRFEAFPWGFMYQAPRFDVAGFSPLRHQIV